MSPASLAYAASPISIPEVIREIVYDLKNLAKSIMDCWMCSLGFSLEAYLMSFALGRIKMSSDVTYLQPLSSRDSSLAVCFV